MPGDNDAGKLTFGVTPQYSSLTSGYGTHEKIITNDMYDPAPQANFGVDVWGESFNETQALFNKRYKKPGFMEYNPRPTLSGEFEDDGAFASNA